MHHEKAGFRPAFLLTRAKRETSPPLAVPIRVAQASVGIEQQSMERLTMGFSGMRAIALVAAAFTVLSGTAGAVEWRSVSSLIDDEIETQAFERYSYVNPDAPKGGQFNSIATGTFDSF